MLSSISSTPVNQRLASQTIITVVVYAIITSCSKPFAVVKGACASRIYWIISKTVAIIVKQTDSINKIYLGIVAGIACPFVVSIGIKFGIIISIYFITTPILCINLSVEVIVYAIVASATAWICFC